MWRGLRSFLWISLVATGTGTSWSAPPKDGDAAARSTLPRDSTIVAVRSDSVYKLPPIPVRARRPLPEEVLHLLPGQISSLDLEAYRIGIASLPQALDRLPGLTIRQTGSVGDYASVSIRGSTAAQVGVYLDGVPLTRAGLGLTNLAELPFASLDRVEIYRGFAPPSLPGSAPGGAIQLVTPRLDGTTAPMSGITLAAGSFGARRAGFRQQGGVGHGWGGLLVVDALRSDGDFGFYNDNATPLRSTDDHMDVRRNNWVRSEEILAKAGRGLGRGARLEVLHQWSRRKQGVAGVPINPTDHTWLGSDHHLTSAVVQPPGLGWAGLRTRAQVYHDWRRDDFDDRLSEIGLGYQDNRDVGQALGVHLGASLVAPQRHFLSVHLDARRETFLPWRGYPPRPPRPIPTPRQKLGPEQRRTGLECALESQWFLHDDRFRIVGALRLRREDDHFSEDLFTTSGTHPAPSGRRDHGAPRLGARLRLLQGTHLEATYGRHQRAPGFLELFGDGGAILGSSDLVAEESTNRDIALDLQRTFGALQVGAEIAHFRNDAENLIVFVPQSQTVFVARNISAARMEGEEIQLRLAAAAPIPRWQLEGNYTYQRTEDVGVDIQIYTGKVLPGRPRHQLYTRASVQVGRLALGYDYRHMSLNYLDRWNDARKKVERRDLHGLDVGLQARRLKLQLAIRNLTNDTARDVAGFPMPGRTLSLGSELHF